jgi:glutamate formiminotransferase/formiminotetrahydrofolate cyclodeaminase
MGLTVAGEPQVSMNLLDIDATPVHAAFDAVAAAARAAGADAGWSEIVGLVPERAADAAASAHLRLSDDIRDHVLEEAVRRAGGPSLSEFIDAVASATPTPGGGTVAAVAGALAAALAAMVGRLTVGRKKYHDVDAEFQGIIAQAENLRSRLLHLGAEDAAAYAAVSAAYAIPKDRAAERTAAIQHALLGASKVPLETLRACREVAALAVRCAEAGNRNAVSDAGVGAMLADAAASGAAYNVRINVVGMPDPSAAAPLVAEAKELVAAARADAARARALVEAAIG